MGYGINKNSARKWVLPVQLTVPKNFPSDLLARLKLAAKAWQDGTKIPLFVFVGVKLSIVEVKCSGNGKNGSYTSGDKGLGKPIGNFSSKLEIDENISDHNLIHELGHVLGLAHEEERPGDKSTNFVPAKRSANAQVQDWLLDMQWNNCRNNQKKFGYIEYGNFDGASVMKYGNSSGKLSPGDIATIKAIYS
jgi:hypothetical protein